MQRGNIGNSAKTHLFKCSLQLKQLLSQKFIFLSNWLWSATWHWLEGGNVPVEVSRGCRRSNIHIDTFLWDAFPSHWMTAHELELSWDGAHLVHPSLISSQINTLCVLWDCPAVRSKMKQKGNDWESFFKNTPLVQAKILAEMHLLKLGFSNWGKENYFPIQAHRKHYFSMVLDCCIFHLLEHEEQLCILKPTVWSKVFVKMVLALHIPL